MLGALAGLVFADTILSTSDLSGPSKGLYVGAIFLVLCALGFVAATSDIVLGFVGRKKTHG